jgi:hypothetical protein
VPFLIVESDWKATSPPTPIVSPNTSNQNFEIAILKRKKKKMPFRQNVVVAATFLVFQANQFISLAVQAKGQKVSYTGVSDEAVLMVYFF